MPARQPPHKPGVRLASEADRLAMCRLAVEGDRLLAASDLEMKLPAPSYTVIYPARTAKRLSAGRPLFSVRW